MIERTDSSVCHYNPTAAGPEEECDPAQDCGRAARWHLLAREGTSGAVETYHACEEHLANAMRIDGVEEFHEFGSSCGLPQTYWILDTCASEVTLIRNGLAWIEAEAYDKPQRPEPGTYIKETDTGQWRRYVDGMWVESEPAPGAVR